MNSAARLVAVVASLVLAAIHLFLTPEHLEEQPYIGVLFALGGVLLVAGAAVTVFGPRRDAGWQVMVVVSVGMFVGYVLSRTTGLPDYKEEWGDPLGIASLVLEVVVVAAAVLAARSPHRRRISGGHVA